MTVGNRPDRARSGTMAAKTAKGHSDGGWGVKAGSKSNAWTPAYLHGEDDSKLDSNGQLNLDFGPAARSDWLEFTGVDPVDGETYCFCTPCQSRMRCRSATISGHAKGPHHLKKLKKVRDSTADHAAKRQRFINGFQITIGHPHPFGTLLRHWTQSSSIWRGICWTGHHLFQLAWMRPPPSETWAFFPRTCMC